MLRRAATSFSRVRLSVIQRANVYVDFQKDDKFTKDLGGKYPTLVEGIKGEYAKDLFRLGYNTNQLGYIKLSLDELKQYEESGALPIAFATLESKLKGSEVAPEVVTLLKAVYDKGLTKDFAEIQKDYNRLYNSHFGVEVGTITLGDSINPKYGDYMNRIKYSAVGTLAEDKTRVFFNQAFSNSDFGGWKAEISGNSIDSTQANELELLVGTKRDVNQVLDQN